jgi:hypothetical protein
MRAKYVSTRESKLNLWYYEATQSCSYRDSLQAVKLPTTFQSQRMQMGGRVRKHHQWLVLARTHVVDVIHHSVEALNKHLNALKAAPLFTGLDPALLVASERRGTAAVDSMAELDAIGVKSECTTFVYWRHCWTGSVLGRWAGWKATIYKDVKDVAYGMKDTPHREWTDPRKSPAKRTNDTPRDFGRTDSGVQKEYLQNMVHAGFLFARKFGRDENGRLSYDLTYELPQLWKDWEHRGRPWTPQKLVAQSQAWPVLDVGDERVKNSLWARFPQPLPATQAPWKRSAWDGELYGTGMI